MINAILNHNCLSQIFQFCHIFEVFISYHITIFSCTRHEHRLVLRLLLEPSSLLSFNYVTSVFQFIIFTNGVAGEHERAHRKV
jgi:hypothetical protein